ncbi:hypothetical protein ACFPRL_02245 [Pseudoclavibacter helvolus]
MQVGRRDSTLESTDGPEKCRTECCRSARHVPSRRGTKCFRDWLVGQLGDCPFATDACTEPCLGANRDRNRQHRLNHTNCDYWSRIRGPNRCRWPDQQRSQCGSHTIGATRLSVAPSAR